MTDPIIVAIIAGSVTTSVTAVGWFITSYLKNRSDAEVNIITARLKSLGEEKENRRKYYERQIEELYGPLFNLASRLITLNHVLYYLIKEGNPERGQFMSEINLEELNAINAQHLSFEETQKVNDFFYEFYFEPIHKEIIEILKTKIHLIGEEKIPKSFYEYLRHSTQEEAQYHLARKHGIDTLSIKGFPFPDYFYDDITNRLTEAVTKHEQYLKADLTQNRTMLIAGS